MKLSPRMRTICLPALAALVTFGLMAGPIICAAEESGPCPKPYIDTIYPRSAGVGQEIKIRGKRFGTDPGKVLFAPGVEAEIVTWTNRRVWVRVPDGAQTGPVTIVLPCDSVSNGKHITVAD
jgi:hypothetical protein